MLHEGVVGAVVDDVVGADKQREQPDQQHEQDLRGTHDHVPGLSRFAPAILLLWPATANSAN